MERPILFSTPMVQAILDGRKTQTRRILKRQPHISVTDIIQSCINWVAAYPNRRAIRPFIYSTKCPYGEVGDILWVRETYTIMEPEHCESMSKRFYYSLKDRNMNTESIRKIYDQILNIKSVHYPENVLAASTTAKIYGITDNTIFKAIVKSQGLTARVEEIGSVNGVKIIAIGKKYEI